MYTCRPRQPEINVRRIVMVLIVFVAVLGLTAGFTTYNTINKSINIMYIDTALSNLSASPSFSFAGILQCICVNVALAIMAVLPGIWHFGAPFGVLAVLLKMFFVGMASAALVMSLGALGYVWAALAIVLPGIAVICVLTWLDCNSLAIWYERMRAYIAKPQVVPIPSSFMVKVVRSGAALGCAIVLEAIFAPIMLALCVRIM